MRREDAVSVKLFRDPGNRFLNIGGRGKRSLKSNGDSYRVDLLSRRASEACFEAEVFSGR